MRNHIVTKDIQGIRLDKYLFKILNKAPASFIYKMLRKKNIVLNDKKASGNEFVTEGDEIKIYLSEETYKKFSDSKDEITKDARYFAPDIIYEDDNLICAYKPGNMLSQKSKNTDYSFNELLIDYLIINKKIDSDLLSKYKPSVLNRLDRNTEGIILFAKTYVCANEISRMLKSRDIHKYYYCIVKGSVKKEILLEGYLQKDKNTNKVTITDNKSALKDYESEIKTRIIPVITRQDISLLEIELITGKTHQIRAHLSSINHPIIGDYKYGDLGVNKRFKAKYGIDHQMLLSYKVIFPKMSENLSGLSYKKIEIKLPDKYKEIIYGDLEK